MGKKPLPPFGRKLLDKLNNQEAINNDVFLVVGDGAWQTAKTFSITQVVLMLPPGDSPYKYQWPVVGLPVLIIDKSNSELEIIKQTAHALLSSQATIVRAVNANNGSLTIFTR